MAFKAVLSKLVVKLNEGEGINAVDNRGEYTRYGTVMSTGNLVKETCIGDVVVFSKLAGFNFFLDGVDYRILKEDDILMISGSLNEANRMPMPLTNGRYYLATEN